MLQRVDHRRTLVLGASPNPHRYSYRAVELLQENHLETIALGNRKGAIHGLEIETDLKPFEHIDTITVYMNQFRQAQYEDYMLSLKPRRIIFNPGAENPDFEQRAEQAGIETLEACTLVMLRIGLY
ncbi:MAG: CoA-binding protein [Flavobacteriales bacterium]|nr:CoA-binding protein [Flavobacteriales bacterium]